MKITKSKTIETITDEIEIKDGLYFFSIGYKGDDSPYEFYKININSEAFGRHKGYAQIDYTFVRNDSDDSCIKTKSSYDNFLPFDVNQFFLQDFSAEKDKTETVKSIALGLVRNTEYRKTIFDSEDKGGLGVLDGQGNYHYPMPTSKSYDERQKIE